MTKTEATVPALAERVRLAKLAGQNAYGRGITCTPALDTELRPLLIGNECLPVLKAWQRGWVEAQLNDTAEDPNDV